MDTSRGQKIHNLDLLRSVAVSYVFVFHVLLVLGASKLLRPLHQLGLWGVLLFFIHTSLVLMLSLERQRKRRAPYPYCRFILQRCFRIYPLAVVIILVVTLLKLPIADFVSHTFVSADFGWKTVLANVLLLQNVVGLDSVEAPLWSLPYEMQMYLVLPAFYWLVQRSRNVAALLAAWIVCCVLVLLLLAKPFGYLLIYAPCFIAGVVAYKRIHEQRRIARVPFWVWPISLAAATAFYLRLPGLKTGWVCCLALGLILPECRELPGERFRRMCEVVARYSYGIYLTHFIFLWVGFVKLGALPQFIQWTVLLGATAFSSFCLYHLVERPLIRLGHRLTATGGSDS